MATTEADLRRLMETLSELYAPLLEGDIDEEASASYKHPHLWLQMGSKTYGLAFRVFLTGGTKYNSGHCDPRHFSNYLGMTKAEAETKLRGIIAGIHAGLAITEASK